MTPTLKQPVAVKESLLPANVKKIVRPQALGKAVSLAFLRWEKRNLEATERFWRCFGFEIAESNERCVIARGAGKSPCIAIANKGARDRLVGLAFAMDASVSLDRYVQKFNAKWLDVNQIPGGGIGVELFDPSGRSVWLLQGQAEVPEREVRPATTSLINDGKVQRRINDMVRTPAKVPEVLRLGHVVIQTVEFDLMMTWYMQVIGMIPTDVQYLADGSPSLAFNRLNLGSNPADHHTLVLVGAIEEKYEHSAYELVDLDALGQGQQILHANGYKPMWGLGRHLLGSQIFDYWFDPDGFEYEHYTDGDLFTSDFETMYSPFEFGSIWAWGQDAPQSMKPKKDLKSLVRIIGLLWRKKLTVQRLKLVSQALDAPARPWH